MRVLHIITGLSDGGAEGVLFRLIKHDASGSVHHVVALASDGKYGPQLRQLGVAVTILGMPRGRLSISGLMGLWRILRTWRADVVQTWMYHADLIGGAAARLAAVPVVWGIRNTTLEAGHSKRSTIWVARLCAWLSRWVPALIVCCAQAAQSVHAALGYDVRRMVVIPNGYDLSSFAPDPLARARLREDWAVSNDVPFFGMVARFDPYKDHGNLIAALAHLKARGLDFKVVLIGTGIDENNTLLVQQIAAACLTERVRLLGPCNDVPAIMNALDIHVLSSAAEAFPNVLAEAMACGTPCVATDVGDSARIVGDTGWLVPPRNSLALADALAEAITALQDAPNWHQRMQCARQRIVQEFDIRRMVERYQQTWQVACRQ